MTEKSEGEYQLVNAVVLPLAEKIAAASGGDRSVLLGYVHYVAVSLFLELARQAASSWELEPRLRQGAMKAHAKIPLVFAFDLVDVLEKNPRGVSIFALPPIVKRDTPSAPEDSFRFDTDIHALFSAIMAATILRDRAAFTDKYASLLHHVLATLLARAYLKASPLLVWQDVVSMIRYLVSLAFELRELCYDSSAMSSPVLKEMLERLKNPV